MDPAGPEKAQWLLGGKWIAGELKNRELERLLQRGEQKEKPQFHFFLCPQPLHKCKGREAG